MSESETGGYDVGTAVPVKRSTREEILKPLKMGGETYDSLIRRMARQYSPPEPPEVEA